MNQSTDAASNAGCNIPADHSRSFIQNQADIDLASVDEGSVREAAHFNASASSSGTETFNVLDCFKKAKGPVSVATTAAKENRGRTARQGAQSRGKLQLKQSSTNF